MPDTLQPHNLPEQADLLELAHDHIMVRELGSDRILFWNRGAQEGYGWSKEEVMGQVTHDLLRTVFPEPFADIEKKFIDEGYWQGELVHTRKDGSLLVVSSRWALWRDSEGTPRSVLEINNNITQQKQAEEQLLRAHQQLEERVRQRTAELERVNLALSREIAGHQQTEKLLRAREEELVEVNAALQILLQQQEKFRGDMEERFIDNLNQLILPYLSDLHNSQLSERQNALLHIISTNLRNLLTPLSRKLAAAELRLTPKEMQVAILVRDGLTSKEISELMGISLRAVTFHRDSLRRKLDLKKTSSQEEAGNLRSALLALSIPSKATG